MWPARRSPPPRGRGLKHLTELGVLSIGDRPLAEPHVGTGRSIAAQPAGRIEIELSGGHHVHVTAPVDRQALADVLAVLEGAPC